MLIVNCIIYYLIEFFNKKKFQQVQPYSGITTTAPRVTMIPKYCDTTTAVLYYCNTAAISRPSKPAVVPAEVP